MKRLGPVLGWTAGGILLAAGVGGWLWNVSRTPLPFIPKNTLVSAVKGQPSPDPRTQKYLDGLQARIREHPGDARPLIALANAYFDDGQLNLAVATYRQALSLQPVNPDVQVDLGTCLLYTGQIEPAVASYRAALEEQPTHVNAHFNLGVAYQAEGRTALAIAEWREAARLTGHPEVKARALALIRGARSSTRAAGS